MRHLALVTTSYPGDTPGSEAAGSFVEDFARELAGHARITVLAASVRASTQCEGNLTVRRFRVPRLPLSLLSAANPADWPALLRTLRAGGAALDRLCRDDRPDHVFALWALPSGYWARSACRRHGIPYSVWALGSDIWSLGRLPVIRGVLKRVLAAASHRYADGLELASDVTAISGLGCDFLPSTRKLPPATDTGRRPRPPYRLAFLGRWHPNKGVDLLMDALARLDDSDWARIADVRIFGGGPLESRVREAANSLRSSGRPVAVGGYLDRQGASDLIGSADYLLLPSRIESIPVIFSDAIQLGTPLIATPVGDLPRLRERYEWGVLAESIDGASYGAAIRLALHTDPAWFEAGLARATSDFDLSAAALRVLAETIVVPR